MKATMNADGVITLKAETPGEAWALRQWIKMATEINQVDDPGGLTMRLKHSWDMRMLAVDAEDPEQPA